jgi:hypothetical protein
MTSEGPVVRYSQVLRRPEVVAKTLDETLAEFVGVSNEEPTEEQALDNGWDAEVVECSEDNEPVTVRKPEIAEFWRENMKRYPEVRKATPPPRSYPGVDNDATKPKDP